MVNQTVVNRQSRKSKLYDIIRDIWNCRLLWIMLIPGILVLILFKVAPLFGLVIAFQDYSPFQGVLKSPWVGLHNFKVFLSDPYCLVLIKNTVLLAFWTVLFSFPFPILFSLFLNEVAIKPIKKTVQTVSFFPYFVSVAVAVSILYTFLSPSDGIVNILLNKLGIKSVFFMAKPEWFRPLYVFLSVWQTFGYNAIIYLAAISQIDQTMYEAADIDGATRWQKIFRVTLPSLTVMIVTMLIVNLGSIMSVDINKVLLMYNPSVYSTADVLQTYVYRVAFAAKGFPQYSLGAAVGLFQSVFAFIIVMLTNKISKKVSETSIF